MALKEDIISWLGSSYKSIFEQTWLGNLDISIGSVQVKPLSLDILQPTLLPKLPPNNQLLFQWSLNWINLGYPVHFRGPKDLKLNSPISLWHSVHFWPYVECNVVLLSVIS